MISIVPRDGRPDFDGRAFARFVTKLFSTRRKQLGGVLGIECVQAAGVDPRDRCEQLDIPTLERLFAATH